MKLYDWAENFWWVEGGLWIWAQGVLGEISGWRERRAEPLVGLEERLFVLGVFFDLGHGNNNKCGCRIRCI